MVIDRSILRCRRIPDLSVYSRHSTEPTGHLELLPSQYLSDHDQSKWIQFEFPPSLPSPILSTNVCRLGQLTLVLELGHQPYLCPPCNFTAAMGTTISQDHSVTLQSTQTGADPCVLFGRCREVSPSMDGRNIANTSPHFPFPVLCWPRCVPLQRQSHDLQVGVIVGRPLHSFLRMHHVHANNSS